MEQKNITQYSINYETKQHPSVKGLQIIEGKNNFPISWLNKQGYCEYHISGTCKKYKITNNT